MLKLLWIGDACIESGFSVVTHSVCNELSAFCDISIYGIRYDGIKRNTFNYYIYPAKKYGDIYGFDNIVEVVKNENPDVVVVFNDLDVVCKYISILREKGVKNKIVP